MCNGFLIPEVRTATQTILTNSFIVRGYVSVTIFRPSPEWRNEYVRYLGAASIIPSTGWPAGNS
jgi:hypothetical protein